MFDLQLLIDYVNTDGHFTADWSRETNPDLQDMKDLREKPRLTVAPLDMISVSNVEIADSIADYQLQANDYSFIVGIHLITTMEDWHTNWNHLHTLLTGWTPYSAREAQFSGFTFRDGKAMGLSNNRCWWLETWVLSKPVTLT